MKNSKKRFKKRNTHIGDGVKKLCSDISNEFSKLCSEVSDHGSGDCGIIVQTQYQAAY